MDLMMKIKQDFQNLVDQYYLNDEVIDVIEDDLNVLILFSLFL